MKKVEAEAAEVLESSAQLMHRVDSSLEYYDRAVELVSEKMVTAAAAYEWASTRKKADLLGLHIIPSQPSVYLDNLGSKIYIDIVQLLLVCRKSIIILRIKALSAKCF